MTLFFGEGFPIKVDYRRKGTLILTSLPEDLVVDCRPPACIAFKAVALHATGLLQQSNSGATPGVDLPREAGKLAGFTEGPSGQFATSSWDMLGKSHQPRVPSGQWHYVRELFAISWLKGIAVNMKLV